MGFIRVSGHSIFDAFADKKLVAPFDALVFTDLPNVKIEQSVVVDIHNTHAGSPAFHSCHTGLFGNIFKFQTAFIQEHFIRPHIAGEIQVRLPVIVEITSAHTAAIEKIHVVEYVKFTTLPQFIFKLKAGFFFAQEFE